MHVESDYRVSSDSVIRERQAVEIKDMKRTFKIGGHGGSHG